MGDGRLKVLIAGFDRGWILDAFGEGVLQAGHGLEELLNFVF